MSLLVLTSAFAATSTDYDITAVKINDMIPGSNAVYAERGKPIDITVYVTCLNDIENVRAKAWIEGYEYEDIEDSSDMFDLTADVDRSIDLTLNIPEDMEASDDYTLYVRLSDKNNEITNPYTLMIEETRHRLHIQDIIFSPSNSVEAGRYLRTDVRLENLGARKEEDIKVTVSISELGVSAATYIDELAAVENPDDDEETSQSTGDLVLLIPKDATTGEYEVKIMAEYNRGHDIIIKRELIHVEGKAGLTDAEAIISMDTSIKELSQGQETTYKIVLASLTDESALYSAEVDGIDTWASAKVEPAFTTLESGKTGEILVKITPNKDAELGSHMFTIKIKEGNSLVKEATLNTEVVKSGIDWSATKTVLEYGFGILVIILIILGLIIAFKRKPSEPLESDTEESYY